jgi:hypothetical protein
MADDIFQWQIPGSSSMAGRSAFVSNDYYDARDRADQEATAYKNWQLRQQQKDAEANRAMLKDLFSGGQVGSNAFGAVPTMDTSNRFEAGLSKSEQRLAALLDDPDSIQQSAAYKFRVGQGQEAIQRQMAAKGMLGSGNRLMELTKYGQDMGSQEYDAQASRLQNLLGTYSQSWLGDKNANTGKFQAQAGAWNTAQGNADRNRYQMGSLLWDMSKPTAGNTQRSVGITNPLQTSPFSVFQ